VSPAISTVSNNCGIVVVSLFLSPVVIRASMGFCSPSHTLTTCAA
jgi:hypothetical protein